MSKVAAAVLPRGLVTVLAVAVAVVAVLGSQRDTSRAATSTWYVSTTGSGSACTASSPCATLQAALLVAQAGDTVLFEPGDYPRQLAYTTTGQGFSAQVTVSAAGEPVRIAGADMRSWHVTFTGLTWTARVRARGDSVTFQTDTFSNGGPILAGNHAALLDSTIVGGTDADGVDVGLGGAPANADVTIARNRIGHLHAGPAKDHVDCIQLFGNSSRVTISANVLFDCDNSEIIVKADIGPISDVSISNNVLQGCAPVGQGGCGWYALYVLSAAYPTSGVSIWHNTIAGGSDLGGSGGPLITFTLRANVMARLGRCGAGEDWNTIGVLAYPCSAGQQSAHDVVIGSALRFPDYSALPPPGRGQ